MSTNLILAHELAERLLEGPNFIVMVNADPNACETEELTEELLEFGSLADGDHPGGYTDSKKWVKIGR